jgi:hypothetical protein
VIRPLLFFLSEMPARSQFKQNVNSSKIVDRCPAKAQTSKNTNSSGHPKVFKTQLHLAPPNTRVFGATKPIVRVSPASRRSKSRPRLPSKAGGREGRRATRLVSRVQACVACYAESLGMMVRQFEVFVCFETAKTLTGIPMPIYLITTHPNPHDHTPSRAR